MKYIAEDDSLKRLHILLPIFAAIVLLVNSCQKPSDDLVVTLAVDPPTPTPYSTVTIVLTSPLNIGVTLTSISIDGVTVCSSDTVPLQYTWFPTEAKSYVVEGYVRNIFGQEGRTQHVVNVLDNTPPIIKSLRVVPGFPEEDSTNYLSIEVEEKESRIVKTAVTVGNETRSVQTTVQPIVIELPRLSQGEYPINAVISSSDFARASTSTVITIYSVDNSEPTLELSFVKNVFSVGENVVLNVKARDDTELRSVIVELDGVEKFKKEFSKTRSIEIPVSLGEFNAPNLHSVVVSVRDGRNKLSIAGSVFAVGTGQASVELKISSTNPSPGELVELRVSTNEYNVKRIFFSVDGNVVSDGRADKYYWIASSGRHILSVMIETEDGRVGLDAIQIDVQDDRPPRIDSFMIGDARLRTDAYTVISPGYYGVRMSISDDTAVKRNNTIMVLISSSPFPAINPVGQVVLVQESVSDDLKRADYVGAISLTNGRFYLIPTGVSDIYENTLQNLSFLLEVR